MSTEAPKKYQVYEFKEKVKDPDRQCLVLSESPISFGEAEAIAGEWGIEPHLIQGFTCPVFFRKGNYSHKEDHIELHKSLDRLLADFISCTGSLASKATVMELVKWSHSQTQNPTEARQ